MERDFKALMAPAAGNGKPSVQQAMMQQGGGSSMNNEEFKDLSERFGKPVDTDSKRSTPTS